MAPDDLATFWTDLAATGLIDRLFAIAREEDLGSAGDVTSEACPLGGDRVSASIVAREAGVLAGWRGVPNLIEAFELRIDPEGCIEDGDRFEKGDRIGTVAGAPAAVLMLERTMLNLLSRLSGIATLTRGYVDAVDGTKARILDTRKTTPGLRALEKYAVRCGGGSSHRMGLHDAVLIKDNHIAGVADDELGEFVRKAAARAPAGVQFIEVEVDRLSQLEVLLGAAAAGVRVDIVLLDNMGPELLREAVALRDARAPGVLLEASGGVTLDSVRAIAETGVDRISSGALTHQAVSLDFGLDRA